jgi:putative phage-type endonuclease
MHQISFNSSSGSPGTSQWHAWRLAGIGGSDAGIIAGEAGLMRKAAWMKTVEYLWQVKTGRRSAEFFNNAAMQRGTDGEAPARAAYEQATGNAVSPVFGEMDAHRFIRSSFDGMSFCGKLICEIKCPSDAVHQMAKNKEVVEYYVPQLAHQALTAWGHPDEWSDEVFEFVSYVPETGDLAIVDKVKNGDGFIVPLLHSLRPMAAKLLDLEIEFWSTVEAGILPCGEEWALASAHYLSVDARLSDVKDELEEARGVLISLLGKKQKMSGAGISIARQDKVGSVDYKKLLIANGLSDVDVEPYRKPPSTSIVVRKLAGGENLGDGQNETSS